MRHDFSYPSSLSRTKPHGELLGEFRSQYQQLMQQIDEESSDVDSSSSSHESNSSVSINLLSILPKVLCDNIIFVHYTIPWHF